MPDYTNPLIILPSAVRVATTQSAYFINEDVRGVTVFFDVTGVDGIGNVQLYLLGHDPVSGNDVSFQSGTPRFAVGTSTVQWASNTLGIRTWAALIIHSGGGNFTYSVSASLGGA